MASRMNESEETFDYVCASVCAKKNRVRESEKYCVQCGKHMCSSCLEYHNDMQNGHTLVEPAKSSGYKPRSSLTEHCPTHPQKIIEHFCVDHDAIACGICAVNDHRSCGEVVYIPEKIHKIFKAAEVKQVSKKITDKTILLSKNESLDDKLTKSLAADKKRSVDKIQDHAKKLIAKIKALEQASLDDVKATCNSLEDFQKMNLKSCSNLKKDLQQVASKLSSKSNDDCQTFVTIKMAAAKLEQADDVLENCKKSAENKLGEYYINPLIETNLDVFQTLGDLKTKPIIARQQTIARQTSATPKGPTAASTRAVSPLKPVSKKEGCSVSQPNENNICDITASCMLPNGYVVLVDTGNKILKCFSPFSKTIIGTCSMPEQLIGICCINDDTVAVTMEDRSFTVVDIKHYAITSTNKPGHRCCGIAYFNGDLFITDGHKTVYIYSLKGDFNRKFQVQEPGRQLSDLGDMTVSKKGLLYIADTHYGVRCFDIYGTVQIRALKCEQLDGYRAVCVDDKFGVFILGCWSKNVVQFGSDGTFLGEVLGKQHCLENPRSISVDSEYNRLFVTGMSNTVIMAKLQE